MVRSLKKPLGPPYDTVTLSRWCNSKHQLPLRMRDSERTRLACRQAAAGRRGQEKAASDLVPSPLSLAQKSLALSTTRFPGKIKTWVSATFPPGPPPRGALPEALQLRGPVGSWMRRRTLVHVGGFHSTRADYGGSCLRGRLGQEPPQGLWLLSPLPPNL